MIANFHFLRPMVLLLLIPAGALIWMIRRHRSGEYAWGRVMEPHLLRLLLVHEKQPTGIWQPLTALALFWGIGAIALAGPTWRQIPAPFSEEKAALAILVKVTPTMLAGDIQPSRLERAVHKIQDILDRRLGGRTALIAYSGSAHMVMPFTKDARMIKLFAGELSPEIMPQVGDVASAAVILANKMLREAKTPGSILLIADDIAADQLEELERQRDNGGAPVHILAMAAGPEVTPPPGSPSAPALDQSAMDSAAKAVGGTLTLPSADDSDVDRLARLIERSMAPADLQEGEHWQDAGYYLLPLLGLILLFGFRRGWVVGY